MPALTLAVVAAAAVYVLGSYLFGGKDDGPAPPGGSGTQTQSPRPPPPHPSRSAATSPHVHTAPRAQTFTPPDYGRSVSPYAQTPSQTQLSSTRFDELASIEDANKLREQARRREMSGARSRRLNERAAKIIFRENNKVSS